MIPSLLANILNSKNHRWQRDGEMGSHICNLAFWRTTWHVHHCSKCTFCLFLSILLGIIFTKIVTRMHKAIIIGWVLSHFLSLPKTRNSKMFIDRKEVKLYSKTILERGNYKNERCCKYWYGNMSVFYC